MRQSESPKVQNVKTLKRVAGWALHVRLAPRSPHTQ